jgi:hypothetical protein
MFPGREQCCCLGVTTTGRYQVTGFTVTNRSLGVRTQVPNFFSLFSNFIRLFSNLCRQSLYPGGYPESSAPPIPSTPQFGIRAKSLTKTNYVFRFCVRTGL